MRALQAAAPWGPDHLTIIEAPEPMPGHGEVLVRMKAVSLNYRDLMMINGMYGRGSAKADALTPFSDGCGVVEAVGNRAEIIFDSGIASGADVARAVALGAKMCFLGRGFVWGVAALGAPGAGHAEFILRDELSNVMSQLGCHRLDELKERLA